MNREARAAPQVPAANSWSTTANPSVARTYFALAAANGKVYAIGGQVGSGSSAVYQTMVEEYDPTANAWRTMVSAPTARSNQGCAVVGNKIYVFGGTTASGVYTTANEAFYPASMLGFFVGGMSAGQKLHATAPLAVADASGNATYLQAGSVYTAANRCKIYAPLGTAVGGNVVY